MRISTIFLDRDGIINDIVLRDGRVSSPRHLSEFQVRSDFERFYNGIVEKGISLFVVSNQPDVARGQLTMENLLEIDGLLQARFALPEIYYCTHDDSHGCQCRKPKPGMILGALEKHKLKADEAVIIGDSYKDILAGQAAGIRTIYRRDSYNATISCEPDLIVESLAEILTLPEFQALS